MSAPLVARHMSSSIHTVCSIPGFNCLDGFDDTFLILFSLGRYINFFLEEKVADIQVRRPFEKHIFIFSSTTDPQVCLADLCLEICRHQRTVQRFFVLLKNIVITFTSLQSWQQPGLQHFQVGFASSGQSFKEKLVRHCTKHTLWQSSVQSQEWQEDSRSLIFSHCACLPSYSH